MIIRFVPQAHAELTDAIAYYEGEASGLGYRFWEEVDEHVSWIEANHEVPRLRPGGYRRVNLRIFPYCISYTIRDSAIWVLAIAHAHRQPEYWIDRPGSAG